MRVLIKFRTIIVLLAPVLILVLFRLLGPGNFKNEAKKWAEPSFNRSNLVNAEDLKGMKGKLLLINLGEGKEAKGIENEINISPETLLKDTDIIKKHDGPVVLFSPETSVSARVWMLFSQMGYRNLFILSDDEVMNCKFRPDTIRPEL